MQVSQLKALWILPPIRNKESVWEQRQLFRQRAEINFILHIFAFEGLPAFTNLYIFMLIIYMYSYANNGTVYVPGFRSRPVLGRLRLREFSAQNRLRLRLLVKEKIILEFFKTDYKKVLNTL